MRSPGIYLIVMIAVFTASLSRVAGEDRAISANSHEFIHVSESYFSHNHDLPYHPGEETPTLVIANSGHAAFSFNIKDYHAYIDNPYAENRKIEQAVFSYLCFTGTFPASRPLSQLHRLNI